MAKIITKREWWKSQVETIILVINFVDELHIDTYLWQSSLACACLRSNDLNLFELLQGSKKTSFMTVRILLQSLPSIECQANIFDIVFCGARFHKDLLPSENIAVSVLDLPWQRVFGFNQLLFHWSESTNPFLLERSQPCLRSLL